MLFRSAVAVSPFEFYEKSFFSLVTETFYFERDIFPSEKIYKPILHEHPFIVVGCPGLLAMLKDQGFQTFSKWIDESYDTIADGEERMDAIMETAEYLHNLSLEDKRQMFTEMKPILEHNRKVLLDKNFLRKNTNTKHLVNILKDQFTYVTSYANEDSFILQHTIDRKKIGRASCRERV